MIAAIDLLELDAELGAAREWPAPATIWHVSTRAIPPRGAITPAVRGYNTRCAGAYPLR